MLCTECSLNKKGILKLFFGFLISIAGNSVVIIQRTPNDINSILTHKKNWNTENSSTDRPTGETVKKKRNVDNMLTPLPVIKGHVV